MREPKSNFRFTPGDPSEVNPFLEFNPPPTGNSREKPVDLTEESQPGSKPQTAQTAPVIPGGLFQSAPSQSGSAPLGDGREQLPDLVELFQPRFRTETSGFQGNSLGPSDGQFRNRPEAAQRIPVASGGLFKSLPSHVRSKSEDTGRKKSIDPNQNLPRETIFQPSLPAIVQPQGLFSGAAAQGFNSQNTSFAILKYLEKPIDLTKISGATSSSQHTHPKPRKSFQDLPFQNNHSPEILPSQSSSQTLTPGHQASTYADLHTSTPSPGRRRKIAIPSSRRSNRSHSTASTSTSRIASGGSPAPNTPNTTSASGSSATVSSINNLFVNTPSICSPSAAIPIVNTPPANTLSPSSSRRNTASSSSTVEQSTPDSRSKGSDIETETEMAFREENSYSVRQESLPPAPVYDQGLQRGLAEVKASLGKIANAMEYSDLVHDSESSLNTLYTETQALSRFQYPETRIVGFIGDSGVGKSSLINSLLDEPNLARSGGGGSACTSFVTEFRNVDASHPQAYTVEIHFMAQNEIRELLEELLRSFRMFYCVSLSQELDNGVDSYKNAADNAWEALESLFGDQSQLTQEFLSGEGSDAWEEIIMKLQTWANNAVANRSGGEQNLVIQESTGSLQGCKDYLDDLSAKSPENGDPVLWPFIKIVRVYLQSPILRTGLVVADLPGFRDSNYARVRATEKYLSHFCDEVFILSDISRAVSNVSIAETKRRCANKPQHVVCTRSEDINAEDESRGHDDDARRVREMNERMQQSREQLKAARVNSRRGNAEERRSHAVRCTELLAEIETLEFGRTQYLVDRRNTKVTTDLQQIYPEMGIFCVSNKLYTDHREDEPHIAESYIELSGVRRLREYCQRVPAKAQLRAVSAYLKHQVPAHLGSLRQWILAGADAVSSETAPVLREALKEVEQVLRRELLLPDGHIDQMRRNLIGSFNRDIIRYTRDRQIPWTNHSVEVSQDWATLYHASYAAFCRKNGCHQPKDSRFRCWNEELISVPGEQLRPQWYMIENWLQSQGDNVEGTISEILHGPSSLLQCNEHYAPSSIKNLLVSLELRGQNISHILENCIREIIKRTDITSNDMMGGHDSSFIGDLMRPAYVACNQEGGPGSDARRKGIMHRHIKDSRLFRNYGDLARDVYTTAVNDHFLSLQSTLSGEVDVIARDLNAVVVDDGETPEVEQTPEVVNRMESEVGSTQSILERVQLVLQQVESRSG